jgi:hypothetical protein
VGIEPVVGFGGFVRARVEGGQHLHCRLIWPPCAATRNRSTMEPKLEADQQTNLLGYSAKGDRPFLSLGKRI